MKTLQTNLPAIPASVFIGSDRKSILFVKHGDKNFIDFQDGNDMAAWSRDALCIGESDYKYSTWYNIKEDQQLQKYFKAVLQESLQDI